MPVDRSELSSIAELLTQVTTRITAMADELYAAKEENAATDLYGIERTLRGVLRRFDKMLTSRR